MLQNSPTNKISKKDYHKAMDKLEKKFALLQQKLREHSLPVMIVLDGWSAAGKGTLISKALQPLDPRYFKMHTMSKTSEEQLMRPYLWRYFINVPNAGAIAIFDKSWCRAVLPQYDEPITKKSINIEKLCNDINAFEEQLISDNVLILKFFLHISKEEQKKRFIEIEKHEDMKWRVASKAWRQNKDYNKRYKDFTEMLEKTGRTTKWTVINADDKRYMTVVFYKEVISKIEAAILAKQNKVESAKSHINLPKTKDILSNFDLSKTISDEEYKPKLDELQKRIAKLGFKLYRKRRSIAIVFEGWDAAGKGGAIKRLTQEIDPRGYDVHPVAAPSKEELSRHYLWRFWRNIPKDGHMAIFDRSWYGRVMVERIEGFCTEHEWRRAYKEINDMEAHLHNHGVMVVKFWLQIDKDEQLRRFESRMNDPMKKHKIVDEDWRNREKWDEYVTAVNDMLLNTSTEYAPWTVIEANNKKYARIKVLEQVIKTLEESL